MTEAEWLSCKDPSKLLEFLQDRLSERKLRLFGCACCRQIWSLFTDDRSRRAVEVVERYADRQASLAEMEEAWHGASDARDLAFGPQSTALCRHRSRLGRVTSWAAFALTNIPPEGCNVCEVIRGDVKEAAEFACDIRGQFRQRKASQAKLLRDITGNVFRPAVVDPSWLTPTVTAMAQVIYEEQPLEDLPILADALEDAGCTAPDILNHCRQPGEHVRGCWVLDLLLSKE